MKVSAQYAQEHLPDLLTAIDTGEEVELTRPGQSSVRLVLVESTPATPPPTAGKRILGAGVGKLRVPTFEEWQAMDARTIPRQPGRLKGIIAVPSDQEWAAMDERLEELMVHAPL